MAEYSIRERILEERLYEAETSRPSEPEHVQNLKHGVVREAYELFLTHFGSCAVNELRAAVAPGRVNLIGDHIDYCDGFVLPMAVPLYTSVLGRPATNQQRGFTNVFSSQFAHPIIISQPYQLSKNQTPSWGRYIQGVLALTGCDLCFDIVIHSIIPMGSGLSSSAALELASYHFVSQFLPEPLPGGVESAKLCRQVEHEYADVPCGIMDQFVIALAEYAHALRIDCRSLSYDLLPMSISHDALFLIVNSGVHHLHADGEYAKRREVVEEVLKISPSCNLLLTSISHDVNKLRRCEHVPNSVYLMSTLGVTLLMKCCRRNPLYLAEMHVIALNMSSMKLKELLKQVKRCLITTSPISDVTCVKAIIPSKVDELVSVTLSCEGVFGSRMTGGGFGGCTVTLVRKDNVDNVKNYIKENYTSGVPTFYESEPVSHACAIELDFLSKM